MSKRMHNYSRHAICCKVPGDEGFITVTAFKISSSASHPSTFSNYLPATLMTTQKEPAPNEADAEENNITQLHAVIK